MTAEELAIAVGSAATRELGSARDRIEHCLSQLNEEQVWRRPAESMNSIGNLLLHLCGNLRQWIVAGLGAAADVRNRPAEFSERGPIPKEVLVKQLDEVVEQAIMALARLTPSQLLEVHRIQGFYVSGIDALFDSIPHFRGHTQEIIHMSRCLLGDAYQFAWKPTTPEEGAAS